MKYLYAIALLAFLPTASMANPAIGNWVNASKVTGVVTDKSHEPMPVREKDECEKAA